MTLEVLTILFPFIFIGIWFLAIFFTSRFGWSKLAKQYSSSTPFQGTSLWFVSIKIGTMANYNNALRLKYNEEGIYLNPIFLFKPFHPALFIPYTEITSAEEVGILFLKQIELSIGTPHITTIKIRKKTYNHFKTLYQAQKSSTAGIKPPPPF